MSSDLPTCITWPALFRILPLLFPMLFLICGIMNISSEWEIGEASSNSRRVRNIHLRANTFGKGIYPPHFPRLWVKYQNCFLKNIVTDTSSFQLFQDDLSLTRMRKAHQTTWQGVIWVHDHYYCNYHYYCNNSSLNDIPV